jgi:hypothetical protein
MAKASCGNIRFTAVGIDELPIRPLGNGING